MIGDRLKTIFTRAAVATGASLVATQAMAQDAATSVLGIGLMSPWILAGAAVAVPAIWWLSRNNPPSPRIESFPSMRLLLGHQTEEVKPDTMPVWHKVLRAAAAMAVIAGLAGPLLDPEQPLPGSSDEPLMLVVDNGWASAENWQERQEAVAVLLERAEREGRQIIILPAALPEDGQDLEMIGPVDATDAQRIFGSMAAQPWPVDHEDALTLLQNSGIDNAAAVYWIGNGLASGGTLELASALDRIGDVTYIDSLDDYNPKVLSQPNESALNMTVEVERSYADRAEEVTLQAMDDAGYVLGAVDIVMAAGDTVATAVFDLPEEIRAQVTRVNIAGESNAGATLLVDDNWRQRPVGIATNPNELVTSPVLRDTFYLESAMAPYARLHSGNIDELLSRPLAVAMVPDDTDLSERDMARLAQWVEDGGMLVRFAGPDLAESSGDELLPVDLMYGNRTLGGSMSWSEPLSIATFDRESPFYGVDIADDIEVTRQVVARPDGNLRERTWASLSDGTPLVTAEQRGEGHIVLFHVSSNAKHHWSNLPLTGTFVNMLRRVVDYSSGVTGVTEGFESLAPWQTLDGQGRLGIPSAAAEPIDAAKIEAGAIGPRTPPGFYGDETTRLAYNLSDAELSFSPLPSAGAMGVTRETLQTEGSNNLTGYLLLAGLLALGVDQGLRAFQNGGRRRRSGSESNNKKSAPTPAGI